AGPIVLAPVRTGTMTLLPSMAHRLPPPAWHPNGAGPLLNTLSSEWPIIMSETLLMTGARTIRLFNELSRVSVYTPDEPPLIVRVPGASGGRMIEPCRRTFGLFGKFERPSPNVRYVGSNVGSPVDWPKPLRSITEMPGTAPARPT